MSDILIAAWVPGARGDFLIRTLYGNINNPGFTTAMVAQGDLKSDYSRTIIKIHNPEDLESFSTMIQQHEAIRISLTSDDEKWQSAYLNCLKHPDHNDLISRLRDRYGLAHTVEEQFSRYENDFDLVVPFEKLFDIGYINDLYQLVNQQELTVAQRDTISYNIDINQTLLQNNPFGFHKNRDIWIPGIADHP